MNEAASETLEGVTISASAARRLNAILKGEQGAALRISVKGGGCSGFQYAFDVERSRAEDDVAVTRDGATVLVDPVSLEMLKGAELDFVDDRLGQSFRRRSMRSPPRVRGGASRSAAEPPPFRGGVAGRGGPTRGNNPAQSWRLLAFIFSNRDFSMRYSD